MSSEQIVTIIAALIVAVGASLVTGIYARPKTKAEARATDASGQVSISGDAREWVKEFRGTAAEAVLRADAAERRADRAERRCDDLERKMDLLVDYTRLLQREVSAATGHPGPIPPPELIPPLTHPGG